MCALIASDQDFGPWSVCVCGPTAARESNSGAACSYHCLPLPLPLPRACCALPGAGLGAPATLLEPHEVVWLGAAALRTLLLHRPDPFGRAVQKLL